MIWLLSRRDRGARIYDEYVEFLVRAPTEEEARKLVHDRIVVEDTGYERDTRESGHPLNEEALGRMRAKQKLWLDPAITLAMVVVDGPSTVITANFKPG